MKRIKFLLHNQTGHITCLKVKSGGPENLLDVLTQYKFCWLGLRPRKF